MIGNPDLNDKNFKVENYEEFYEHHTFVETTDEQAVNVHQYIPRFGWAFDVVEELKPKNLLDLGTLEGSFPITIATHFGIPCTGVDLTKDGIALATERAKKFGLKNVQFFQGAVETRLDYLAAGNEKFDIVTAFELLEHVKNPKALLEKIDKVLAPGGSVLISTPAFESPLYGMDDEKNKCHIRLYTERDEDYEATNKYGNVRKATSITKEIGKSRIKEMGTYSHLINLRYQ